MLPLFLLLVGLDREKVPVVLVDSEWTFLERGRHLPLMESHNVVQDVFGELEVFLAVGSEVELFCQALDVQVSEAGLQEPLIQQEVGDHADAFLVGDFLTAKLIDGHLEDTFAELANRVRNHRDAFEHLPSDGVDNI